MSEKIAQGKAGIVATKKSDPVTVSNVLLTDSQSKSGSNESLASEMETVIIQGTDFAKEFEKPNDRASHIKIGRAKQKVISGGQGSILQCTSVSSVASGNAGKTTATPQKTAAKPPDGPCRTSDLEGSAGSNSCAVKSALKKVTPTGTASVTAPAKTGHVATKANVNVSSKTGNIANANKPNNMFSRPTPPVAVSGRPVEVAANIGHRPNFPNMRSTIQAPGGVFPGAVQPRGRGPGTNFNPQRPASRMPANLFNAGRPNVQVVNVRNPRSMTPSSGYGAVRPALGITRPTGPMPVRLASGCPVNKMDVRRPNAANSTVRQRPLVPDKPSVKPCLNTPTKPGISEANKINSMNNTAESGRKNAEKPNPVNKTSPHPVTTKIGCTGSVAASTKPTESALKACNHTTTKPVDNVSLGSDKSCAQGGSSSSSSSSSNISNTVKTAGKPVTTNPPQSGSNQLFKVSSNNTTGNKTVKPTNSDASETTKTPAALLQPPPSSSTCDNVDVLPSQPSTASEKEQNVADSAGTCDNGEALEDVEGSKGGISFSFNRKMGQKLTSSVPFGKEEEKAPNSADTEKDSKTEAAKEESCAEKSQDSNKEMPSAGMSFLKVLNKEQTLELDWPVEMIHYTKTEPSISYSCNPLFFDFKELLSKDKCHKEENTSSNQMKRKSDGDASVSKTEPNNADEKEKETKSQLNADDAKAEKSSVKKSRKKKRKLSSQRHTDEDETKGKKKKKKKHSSKKREVKSEGGISEKEEDKNAVDASKSKRHKKKKKRSHHLGPKSDLEQGHGEGGDGDGVTKSKTSHKSKHKKHKSRKSKKKRHKHDEFEKDSNSGHESEEDVAASAVTEPKNKKHKKKKPPQAGKDSSNFSSEDELSKVQKAKSKVASSGIAGEKVIAATAGEPDGKLATVAVCEEEKDVSKKRNVAGNNPTQTLESVDESKKTKKDEAGAAKPGSCTERKRPTGELDSPVGSKKKKLSSKNMCLKSEDTWSKMETIFEARSDPEGNKASWDTSSDSDVASHENKPNIKSKSADAGKRKKLSNPSQPSEKPENNPNPASKTSGSAVKVEPKAETFHNSSGSESDRPASAKQIYKRKKSYSGESHHSDSHCRSRDRSYSSSYSDRDSHYSDKSKHRHSRSHSSSRSRSRSRSASYERHSSRRGRRYSYSSYSDEDYRYRRGHSRSRSCSRRRSRTRSRSYSRSRRYRSYSSEHHRSYSSSSSRSRSRSESRGRSRSYSYSRSHSKSTSYSRSRSRSRSYHKSHSRSRSPHKSSKQDYRHKSSPEHRYYSSKKNSKHVSGGKGENEKGGKLDPAKIPLPIMPGDGKEEPGEVPEKSKDKMFPADTTKAATPAAVTPGPEVAPTLHAVGTDVTVAGGTGEPEAKSGLINIPLPPFQVAENAQLGKVDSVDGQLRPPPPPPHMLSMPHYTNTGDCLMHHQIPDLSQPPPSASLMANCPPPPPPPPPPMLNNNNNPGMPATRLGAPSLYGHLSVPPQDVTRMNAPPPPPPPKCGVDSSMRMPLPFTPRSVTRLEQSSKENPSLSKSPIESTLQAPSAAATDETAEKEMTPPLPPPKSPPPQPPPPPKKEDEKKNCEEISPMQPIIPPEQVEQYKHLQEMAQKHAMKQQRRQRLKDTGQAEESDDDESMEMEGQVSTMVSDEECDEQPGILALPEPEPQHLQQQILLPHAQHAGSPVIAQHVVPFSQQQIIIPPSSLLQSQGAFPIQAGGPMIAIPHTAAHHHHHHPHHPLAGHHALHHAFHPAAAAGVPLAAAAASHPFHHQLIAAAPSQLVPYSSPQPILTQLHPPGPIIIGHQILIPRFPRAPM